MGKETMIKARDSCMRRAVLILVMIMGILGIALILLEGEDDKYLIIYNVISILIICIMQVIKNVFKFNYRVVTIFQLISVIGLLYFEIYGVVLLVPIIIFELLEKSAPLYISILINILLVLAFNRENIIFALIYIVILDLYLYEVKMHQQIRDELMLANKSTREERFIMEEKIINLNKYLEQNNLMTTLRERNFMAQKLHDHLGHRITSSIMQLEVTKETLGNDIELSRKYLVTAMDNLREGMDEIRELLSNVKVRDKVVGLEDIKEAVLKFQYSTGIVTTINVDGDIDRIRLNQIVVIETNIMEALTNAAKYSKATEVQISFYMYNKIARIEIRDNGVGCNSVHKGMGLKGIEERLESINGRLRIDNDKGFVINMIINLGE